MMKNKMILAVALSLGMFSAPASWALTFQDVEFSIYDNNNGTLTLSINNVDNASGNWTGVDYLSSFSLKNTGATLTGATPGSWGISGFELNGQGDGCPGPGGGANNYCFTSSTPYQLANNNSFIITYTGTLDQTAHLKVAFMTSENQTGATGDLLSKDISVPEPASLMLLGAGLAGIGIWRRKLV